MLSSSTLRDPLLGARPSLVKPRLHLVLLAVLARNTAEHLAGKPHKVPPPQRILPRPVSPLLLFARQARAVAELPAADAHIATDGQEIEANLREAVPADAALQDGDDGGGEGGRVRLTGPVGYGMRLEAVELVEQAVDGGVGDEVIDVVGLVVVAVADGLVDEGGGAREGVVDFAHLLGVAQHFAAEVGREGGGEVAERLQGGAHVELLVGGLRGGQGGGGVLVEEDGEEGLGGAGVLDGLVREEESAACVGVVGAIFGLVSVAGGRR